VNLALAQINPVIGDLAGNVALMRSRIADARDAGAQLVLFGELAVSGYPPEDLLLRSDFLAACEAAVSEVAAAAEGVVVAFGAPRQGASDLHNALVVAAEGRVQAVYDKCHLPHYGAFDEGRYFGPGSGSPLVRVAGRLVGLTVCADLWIGDGPAARAVRAGAELVLNASASPFHLGKSREREAMVVQRARDLVCPIAYVNLWGGQDELVFDGGSLVVDHAGRVVARAEHFAEELLLVELDLRPVRAARLRDPRLRAGREGGDPSLEAWAREAVSLPAPDVAPGALAPARVAELAVPEHELWTALRLGVCDHAAKTGAAHAVVGLGGGIDSSVVAVLACDALGPENVTAVVMPSADDDPRAAAAAVELVGRLGCRLREVPLDALSEAYGAVLDAELDAEHSQTAERVQARIRSNVLMALSNAYGWLLLSTGNKSELACGYATLYGETFGGFAPLKDVPRTTVVGLALWRDAVDPARPIPTTVLEHPHDGVRPDHWQEDGLPPFEQVDPILQAYVEGDEDPAELVRRGHDAEVVRRVVDLVERAEYKRRQAPPGIRVSGRAFGSDRRMPIVHGFVSGALDAVPEQPAVRPAA
jgi:NAD+ synthase (glutamine-hydrolysing)